MLQFKTGLAGRHTGRGLGSPAMFSLRRLVVENTPTTKPELWADVSGVLWRRLSAWVNTRVDPAWPKTPLIARLAGNGLMLEVVPGDVIGMPIAQFGVYEFGVSSIVREYLSAGDTFVDVGANIGYYTVLSAGIVGRGGKVFAFEPSASVRARLLRNVELNRLTQVEVRAEAVTAESGVVHLVESADSNNDGLGFVDTQSKDGVEVRAVRLDELAELRDRPVALMKVDVEGGEPEVFRGATDLLRTSDAPSIIFESFKLERDAAILRDLGYQIFQPMLANGAIALTSNLDAPPYRAWEAPNFLAVKSPRGLRFAERLRKS